MDLIERYVQEVARRLPRKQRDDVALELRSSLEDSLESRAGVPLEDAEEEQAVALLLEFGPPAEVAASYRSGPSYLVGPALYPSFIKTMRVCLLVVGGLILLATLVDLVGSSGTFRELGRIVLDTVSSIQSAFISVLGIVVLIFAIIEHVSSPEHSEETEWDPCELPPVVEDRDRLDGTGELIGMTLAGLAFLLINFMPGWLQAQVWVNEVRYTVPMVGPGSQTHIHWLNAYLLLSIALGIVVLRQGRWKVATRAADGVISFLLVVFFWGLFNAGQALFPDVPTLLERGWPPEEAADFVGLTTEVLASLLWWGLLAALVASIWGSISKLIAFGRSASG